MNVSDAAARAFETIERREQDVTAAFSPAAAPVADTYFVTAAANGRIAYTQRNDFTVRDGALVDAAGDAVMGYADGSATLAPLRVDPADRAMGAFEHARVSATGAFVYDRRETDPATGKSRMEQQTGGQLALARFAPGTQLRHLGSDRAAAPPGVAPYLFAINDPAVQTQTVQRLQEAFMSFDALRAAGKAEGGLQKTVMDLLK